MLAFVVHESIRTSGHLAFTLAVLTTSGVAMAALALSQQFGSSEVVVGNDWKVSDTTPFGCFVNPIMPLVGLPFVLAAACSCAVRLPFGQMTRVAITPVKAVDVVQRKTVALVG